MKRSIYFIIFFFFLCGIALASNGEVILTPINPPVPCPRAPAINRIGVAVTATSDGSEVAICFSTPASQATITLTDETGGIIYQETVDTNTALDFYISVGGLDGGCYLLTIRYGNGTLSGRIEL